MRVQSPVLMGGWLTDVSHSVLNVARSGIGLFSKIRGDKEDVVVEGAAPVNYANMAVYGTLAVLAVLIVVKAPKKASK